MLKVVFFDAAGTIFETRAPVGESYARIAREYGVDATAAQVSAGFRRAFHNAEGLAFGPGHSGAELRELERRWWREIVAETFAGLGTFTDFDAYFDALFAFFGDPANWRADPQAAATLERLKAGGMQLGVVSNFDFRLYRILDGLGLSRYFDSITISSEAGYAKPSPKLFEAALTRHNASPGEALHVGDVEHLDVQGARAAGIAAVLIDRSMRERIRLADRTARISSLESVPDAAREMRL
jgi:putative hydrolase of the HAD superfamily